MRVILVDPGFGEKSFNAFGSIQHASVIHSGLCYISACAKEKGFDVGLIDIRTLRNWNHFGARLIEENPAVVGFTMRSTDKDMVGRLARITKEALPEAKIIVGGIHPTLYTGEVESNQDYDCIITHEAELTFPKTLEAIRDGAAIERVIRGETPDLNALPFPDWELYDFQKSIMMPSYAGVFKAPMVTMIGSRGCPYRCSFCAPHSERMYGKGVRFVDVDRVIEELKVLRERYSFNSIKFYDYSFTANPDWCLEFCEKYRSNGFTQNFICQTRADLIVRRPDLIAELKKVGLKLMLVGFESGSPRILDILEKGTTPEQNLEAARILKRNGVMVGASFMLGVPGETREDVCQTVELAKKIRPHFLSCAFFTPIPGNHLYEYSIENNLSLVKNCEEMMNFSPGAPKIKGIDYDYDRKAAEEMMGSRFGGKLSGKMIRYLYVKTKEHYRIRSVLIWLYSKWVTSRAYQKLVERKSV